MVAELRAKPMGPPDALREYAHIVGAQENWLARLEGRTPTLAIWPALTRDELASASDRAMAGYDAYLARLDPATLPSKVHYTNSAGKLFDTPVSDILLHVPMHSQYHRGKVNHILRAAGLEPVPTDFIAFVRGVPAATTRN